MGEPCVKLGEGGGVEVGVGESAGFELRCLLGLWVGGGGGGAGGLLARGEDEFGGLRSVGRHAVSAGCEDPESVAEAVILTHELGLRWQHCS